MKTPRIRDFDPKSVPELGSPLDDMPTIRPAVSSEVSDQAPPEFRPSYTVSNPSLSPDRRTSGEPYARTPGRRTITRYAFDIFQDQVESLRDFSLEEKIRGEKGSMSQMVREAIDAYLTKRHRVDE